MPNRTRLNIVSLFLCAVSVLSCGGRSESVAGDMDDFSYGGRRGVSFGPSATGETIDLATYRGRFVWVDFSAPWCGPCNAQAPVLQKLEREYAGRVVFVTLLQSAADPRSPATGATARQWASQYGIEPAHVAASLEGQRAVPTHMIFSPLGQTMYVQSGVHPESFVRSRLELAIRQYEEWYAENRNSMSVMLGEIGDDG